MVTYAAMKMYNDSWPKQMAAKLGQLRINVLENSVNGRVPSICS